jgi:hypothetical protein
MEMTITAVVSILKNCLINKMKGFHVIEIRMNTRRLNFLSLICWIYFLSFSRKNK